MKNDKELDEILAEIGREHRKIGAPEWLEPVLFAAAGKGNRAVGKPRLRLAWTLAAAAILLAAVATAGVIWETRGSHRTQTPQARSVPAPQLRPGPMLASMRGTAGESVPAKSGLLRRAGRDSARVASTKQPAWNSLDEFVALPVSEGLPPAAELSVIRIELRASDLQQYGLQAPADGVRRTMLADFVVGEDGLPRAIRIVRNTSINGGEL
jgi:hypothetical protein